MNKNNFFVKFAFLYKHAILITIEDIKTLCEVFLQIIKSLFNFTVNCLFGVFIPVFEIIIAMKIEYLDEEAARGEGYYLKQGKKKELKNESKNNISRSK
ncbi:MAG: hypothetical protein LBK69_05430 [Syntrophomonadaceae bacterium]|nr:hypothetical protein [Syntrophomonadaceae bacterium]